MRFCWYARSYPTLTYQSFDVFISLDNHILLILLQYQSDCSTFFAVQSYSFKFK